MTRTTPLTHFHYDYVSSHINQTMLVERLIEQGIVSYDEITNIYDSETDESREVFQWLAFPNFWKTDYEYLISAHIPVIDSEYGAWVGITSYGSPYDLYVYPELINAIFELDISYKDINRLK